MDVWHIILYAFGAFVALRVLAQLMQRHRLATLRELAEERQARLAGESPAEQIADEPDTKAA